MANEKVAVFLKDFTLKKSADTFFQRYSEPYFVSFTITGSETGIDQMFAKPMIFPNIRARDTIQFGGNGHLLARPKVPKEGFVFYSVLFMESDSDFRRIGETMNKATTEIWKNIKDTLKTNPKAYIGASIGNAALQTLSLLFSQNNDDLLFRVTGTLLKDSRFEAGRVFRFANDWIDCGITTKIIGSNEFDDFSKTDTFKNFQAFNPTIEESNDSSDYSGYLAQKLQIID